MPVPRCMVERDLPQVNLILSKAFTHARLKNGLQNSRVPLCRREFLQMYLAAHPHGAFVIERNERIIAYCFSRLWGSVGWIGPLSVLPAEEGKGYGKQVAAAAIEVLESAGAKTIGLEMPAYSCRNLAFYTKLGFRPNKLTVDLVRPVSDANPGCLDDEVEMVTFASLSPGEKQKYVSMLQSFSNHLQEGLDYTREIQLANDFKVGDGRLIFLDGRLIGFCFAHTETYSEEENREYLKVNALQMAASEPLSSLRLFIRCMEDWARAENLTSIYLRVPTRYHRGFEFLLQENFFAVNSDLRMTLDGFPLRDDPQKINFNKWE